MDERTSPTAQPGKEFLVFPATPTLQHDFTIQLGSSKITPSTSVRNLGVIFDDQLTFKEHIAKTARSCRFALHNIRKIRPFLTEHAAQLLVQAVVISRLDLQCSSGWTSKHNQTSTNDSECSGTTGLQRAQKSPCYTSLYLLVLATGCSLHQVQDIDACIQNDHRLSTSTHYYESTSPPEVWDLLVSDALWYHHREAQNHSPEHSRSPFLAG